MVEGNSEARIILIQQKQEHHQAIKKHGKNIPQHCQTNIVFVSPWLPA